MLTKKTFALVLLLALIILAFRVTLHLSSRPTTGLVEVSGQVLNEPYLKNSKLVFRIKNYKVESEYLNLNYGDFVTVTGKLQEGVIEANKVSVADPKGLNWFLTETRVRLNKQIQKNLPSPQSQLLSGVVLGVKSNLNSDFRQDLINTGTLHVVVVSGYNIALVGGLALSLSPTIGRRKASILAAFLIISYSLLVGLTAPTIRAAIMAILTILATLFGRKALAGYLLLLTAYVMILVSPENLIDVSFQLTFLATSGLIIFAEPIKLRLKKFNRAISDPLSTTLAAQVLVVPLIFFTFGNVSFLAPIVNILVLWTIPITTILGFFYLLFLQLNSFVAALLGYLLLIPLTFFTFVVEFFGNFEFLAIKSEAGNWISVLGYILLLLGLILKFLKPTYDQKV